MIIVLCCARIEAIIEAISGLWRRRRCHRTIKGCRRRRQCLLKVDFRRCLMDRWVYWTHFGCRRDSTFNFKVHFLVRAGVWWTWWWSWISRRCKRAAVVIIHVVIVVGRHSFILHIGRWRLIVSRRWDWWWCAICHQLNAGIGWVWGTRGVVAGVVISGITRTTLVISCRIICQISLRTSSRLCMLSTTRTIFVIGMFRHVNYAESFGLFDKWSTILWC